MNLVIVEMVIYKSTMEEIKQVNATLGDKPTKSRKIIDYLNSLNNKKFEYF